MRELLALHSEHFEVVAKAVNGRDALDKFFDTEPDVCLLDIRMPMMSGLEVASEIGDRAKIVLCAAYDQFAIAAFERGVVDYLLKPIAADRLAVTLARLLGTVGVPADDLTRVMHLLNRCFLFWIAALAWVGTGVSHAQMQPATATAIPVQDLFRSPDVLRPTLSPDGNYLVFLARSGNRLGLAVIDIEKRTSRMIVTLPDADIIEHYWVNSTRLVFVTGNVFDAAGTVSPWRTGGLFAVDRDGGDTRRLALPMGDGRSLIIRPRYTRVMATLADGGDHIIVAANERDFDSSDVYRLNTRSARKTLLSYDNPGDVQLWALDRDGLPRAALSGKGTQSGVDAHPAGRCGCAILSYTVSVNVGAMLRQRGGR